MVHLGPFERGEHIVLVGRHELIGWRHHVARVIKGKVVHGELAGEVSFLVEGISHLAHALHLLVLEAIGCIALEEEMFIEVGGGLCGNSHAEPVDGVLREHRVNRPDIDLGRFLGVETCFHKVFYKCFGHPQHGFEALDLLQPAHE